MGIVFATYECSPADPRLAALEKDLKALGGACALERVWVFPPDVTVDQVAKAMSAQVKPQDKCFVGTVSRPAQWGGLGSKWTGWFTQNL